MSAPACAHAFFAVAVELGGVGTLYWQCRRCGLKKFDPPKDSRTCPRCGRNYAWFGARAGGHFRRCETCQPALMRRRR